MYGGTCSSRSQLRRCDTRARCRRELTAGFDAVSCGRPASAQTECLVSSRRLLELCDRDRSDLSHFVREQRAVAVEPVPRYAAALMNTRHDPDDEYPLCVSRSNSIVRRRRLAIPALRRVAPSVGNVSLSLGRPPEHGGEGSPHHFRGGRRDAIRRGLRRACWAPRTIRQQPEVRCYSASAVCGGPSRAP